ncbi:MAG: DUF58 domain-containing protein [Pseudomonadota bacterium]
MIPTQRLLAAVAALVGLAILVAIKPTWTQQWQLLAAALAFAAIIDAVLVFGRRIPEVTRTLPASLALGQPAEVRLTMTLPERATPLEVGISDHIPQHTTAKGMPVSASVNPSEPTTIRYTVSSSRRGDLVFPRCDMRIRSPLGLWWRQTRVNVHSGIRCYPNFSSITQLLEFEATSSLATTGLRLSRRRGEGIEFHQLREYRDGDPMRAVDWRATARVKRLISREYQDERDQHVIILLDTGRRMLARDGELSHFDHAINAALLLTYVALRQGDAVGLATIGDDRPWLPPRKGAAAINGVLNHLYDIEPSPVEVDFAEVAQQVTVLQKRRALVVTLSNVRDEDADDLQQGLHLLQRRHLVMLASLREQVLDETLTKPITKFDDALRFSATERYLDVRQSTHRLLSARGVLVDDCLPDQLAATVTNRYLSIKRAGQL